MRVLVVEDEKDMNKLISRNLVVAGYGVDSCFDGEEALDYLECATYDIMLLDVMIPKIDGFSLLKKIRQRKIETPVIFLTAKDAIEDRVNGLDLGANDYLVKPFSFEELLARIRVITRMKAGKIDSTLKVADLTLDTSSKEVKRKGELISLSAKEYAILEYMMYNENVVLTRDKIEQHIWSYDYVGESNMINVYIRYLRKKIDEPYEKKLIHTVRGSGYVLKE